MRFFKKIHMEVKERIQSKAKELFMHFGFRSVTMDEIAGQLGISKKTIYQFFKDKDELVEAVMHEQMNFMKTECVRQFHESENAVEEIFRDMDSMAEIMDALNPQIVFDLEKFYPKTFEGFKKHKNNFLMDVIKKNLQRGIREELYRPDLDIDIIAKFRLESSFIAFNQDLFPYGRYRLLQVASEIYHHYLHGIATLKGKKLIEKYIHQREKNKSLAL